MYPRIIVKINKLRENIEKISDIVHKKNMSYMLVTKVFRADRDILKLISDLDFDYIADSRIMNLKNIHNLQINKKKVLLRIPMISELEDVVKYSDIALISELKTIKKLSEEAKKQNKNFGLILMIDIGDLREGIYNEDHNIYIKEILDSDNLYLEGIGTNLTCYGGIIPDEENMSRLSKLASDIEHEFDIKLNIVSGGNSSSYYMLDKIPENINNLRLGELVIFGRESAFIQNIDFLHQDVFEIQAEVVEVKEKDSKPVGTSTFNAFAKKVEFEDRGIIKRAILAIGKQDVDHNYLKPVNEDIEILGGSSDHLILNVTGLETEVGDIISFVPEYTGVLNAFTSDYVHKSIK